MGSRGAARSGEDLVRGAKEGVGSIPDPIPISS